MAFRRTCPFQQSFVTFIIIVFLLNSFNIGKFDYFTGLTIPQQYVCIGAEDLPKLFKVTASTSDRAIDVTQKHFFLGYKPLVIGILFDENTADVRKCCLQFHTETITETFNWRGFPIGRHAVARLVLEQVNCRLVEGKKFILFRGVYGEHSFIDRKRQFINKFKNWFHSQSEGNVGLSGNLHDQVRIAYSIPRIIALITLQEENRMNMFPTDLHGKISDNAYVSSLRIGGKANSQVERVGKIVISTVEASTFQRVYELGKNHMQELKEPETFKCAPEESKEFSIPLPESVLLYRELQRKESIDYGIHRIHFYDIANEKLLKTGSTLAHIHQYYAQWRMNMGLKTEMLLRK